MSQQRPLVYFIQEASIPLAESQLNFGGGPAKIWITPLVKKKTLLSEIYGISIVCSTIAKRIGW